MTQFDLISEPWVPVLDHDGAERELGLLGLLHRAHDLKAIRDPLPTVEFGLYRLLVALVIDIFQPGSLDALGSILSGGRFDESRVTSYFTELHDRFDLFSRTHPFLQESAMAGEPVKPLAGLLHPVPAGTNAAHFHHGHEDSFVVCPAAAARLLATIAPFMTAGGAGLSPSINGAPPWYVLIVGENLFETLCLNAYSIGGANYPLGLPAWRDDTRLTTGRRSGAALLEGLTWRPRRIQLAVGEGGVCALTGRTVQTLVRGMRFAPGASCDFHWRDPSVPDKIDDKGPKVLRPQEGREVWRDTGPLALLHQRNSQGGDGAVNFRRPLLVEQFRQLASEGLLPTRPKLRLQLFAIRTDMKMKVFEWYREALSLPRDLVLHDWFHTAIQDSIDRAAEVARSLRAAIKATYDREGASNASAFDNLVGRAERQFWQALRPRFDTLLNDLAKLSAAQKNEAQIVFDRWYGELRRTACDTFWDAVKDLDADARALKRQTLAERLLQKKIAFALASDEQKAAWKSRKSSKSKPAAQATEGGQKP